MTVAGSRSVTVDQVLALIPDLATLAVITDFDGTLAEIVDDPAEARPLLGVAEDLVALAGLCPLVAVVSGRPVSFLVSALSFPSRSHTPDGSRSETGCYPLLCGIYGLERWSAGGGVKLDERAVACRAALDAAADRSSEALGSDVDVEHKGLGVTLHWRRHRQVEAAVRDVGNQLANELGLGLRDGKMCVELIPDLGVDKGTVASGLLARRAERMPGRVGSPVPARGVHTACVIGDDAGDLAAFRAVRSALGPKSVCIAVGGAETPSELLGAADGVLDAPREVAAFLKALANRR